MFQTACAIVIGVMASSAMAADVGVSINVGEPSYYGRIDIGNVPQPPQVIYARPVYAQPAPVGTNYQPLYLRVPPGYERHWNNHCREYYACNRPVYFVREDWYQRQYSRRDREEDSRGDQGRGRVDERRGEQGQQGRGEDRRGDQGRGRGEDRGRGNENH